MCVCVCLREREREREKGGRKEREYQGNIEYSRDSRYGEGKYGQTEYGQSCIMCVCV